MYMENISTPNEGEEQV